MPAPHWDNEDHSASQPKKVNLAIVQYDVRDRVKSLTARFIESLRGIGADIHPNSEWSFTQAVELYAQRRINEALAFDPKRIDLEAHKSDTDMQEQAFHTKIALLGMTGGMKQTIETAFYALDNRSHGADMFVKTLNTIIERKIQLVQGGRGRY